MGLTRKMSDRILIAGLGNIFLGDDAFGVEVAGQLTHRALPANVEVRDFGIRGLDLAYALLEGYRAVILVDACPRGGVPGELYLIEPDMSAGDEAAPCVPLIDTHEMHPERVLRLVRSLGGSLDRIILVGCEPAAADAYEEMQPGLSDAVRRAISPAIEMILQLVAALNTGTLPAELSTTNLPGTSSSVA